MLMGVGVVEDGEQVDGGLLLVYLPHLAVDALTYSTWQTSRQIKKRSHRSLCLARKLRIVRAVACDGDDDDGDGR